MERRYEKGGQFSYSSTSRTSRHYSNKRDNDPYRPRSMELDATQRFDRKSEQEGKPALGRKREGLKCYLCGKIGHMKKDCRSTNIVDRR